MMKKPRILCIGMPVRDLTFRVQGLPARGFKVGAEHFEEIAGGNALNAAIAISKLGGRAAICGPMGDAGETSSRYIFDKMAELGIEMQDIVHMPGLGDADLRHHDRSQRRAHHHHLPRSRIVEGAAARHRQAA